MSAPPAIDTTFRSVASQPNPASDQAFVAGGVAAANELTPAAQMAKLWGSETTAEKYCAGPVATVPGFEALHRMTVQLLSETLGAQSKLLVLGCGGGLEIRSFAQARPGWTFVGVDPFKPMVDLARRTIGPELMQRVELVQAYIPDAPAGPFDGATCLLTLHMIEDNGAKLQALQAIRSRLRPGAPFVMAHLCIDKYAPTADALVCRYARYEGLTEEQIQVRKGFILKLLQCVSPERDEQLLREAGFTGIDLFYRGLSWSGWIAYA